MSKWFKAGKTYIEMEPYRSPEILEVFKCLYSGSVDSVVDHLVAFGESTNAYPGNEWQLQLKQISKKKLESADEKFPWVEAVWDESQKEHYWRAMTPADVQ